MRIFSWQYAFGLTSAGILLGYGEISFLAVAAGCLLIIMAGRLSRRCYQALFITGFIMLGWLLSLRIPALPPIMEPTTTSLMGTIIQIPVNEDNYQQSLLRCNDRGRYYQQVMLYLPSSVSVKLGDTLRVTGKLSTVKGGRNPGEPDRRRWKGFQHLYYQFKADNQGVEMVKPAPQTLRQNWYECFVDQAHQWMPDREAAILTSIIWGDASGLNDDDYRLFQETGLLHVFAASGMNVGCLMLAAALLIGLFSRQRLPAVGGGLLLTGAYVVLIGWPVSVLRAALMALVAGLAYWGGRQQQLKESLFLAATLLLIIDPGWLFTPGFQLTIAATWGLLVLSPVLASWWFPDRQVWWQRALLSLLAAELAVWPLTVYYFNLVAPVSLLANVVLALVISVLVVLGILALFTCPLPIIHIIFWLPCYYLLEITLLVTNALHSLPAGHWWVKSPSLVIIVIYFVLLWSLTVINVRRLRLSIMLVLLIVLVGVSWPKVPGGSLQVTFLDVGQGDCIHISTPRGRQLLIDGGGSAQYPVGRLIVMPYLHRQGINKLDLVINTHPHDDHVLGLLEVLQVTPCRGVVFPQSLFDHPLTERARRQIPANIEVGYWQTGDKIKLDKDIWLRVLSPDGLPAAEVNNSSLVLLLEANDLQVLLMGDAEAPIARRLREQGLAPVEVIKIGHHGSARSRAPEFYQSIRPDLAVINVGKNNGFGHPHPALVNELQSQGIKVLRTDQMGGISITQEQGEILVTTHARD